MLRPILGHDGVGRDHVQCNDQSPVPLCDLHVDGVSISPSNATSNFGVMMDSAGTMSNIMTKALSLYLIFMLTASVYLLLILRPILGS